MLKLLADKSLSNSFKNNIIVTWMHQTDYQFKNTAESFPHFINFFSMKVEGQSLVIVTNYPS